MGAWMDFAKAVFHWIAMGPVVVFGTCLAGDRQPVASDADRQQEDGRSSG